MKEGALVSQAKLIPRNHVAKSTFRDWLSLASNSLSTESLAEK